MTPDDDLATAAARGDEAFPIPPPVWPDAQGRTVPKQR
jgi:hypothetical protein